MKQQLLLLKDVDGLGRSGDIVTAKPGFIRNFLLPQKHGVIADAHTIKMQARLKEEREKQAAVDRKEAQALADKLTAVVLQVETKVDVEGRMYGSVTQKEMISLLNEQGFDLERKNITLPQAIKKLGKHTIPLRLKEGVEAHFTLEVVPEAGSAPVAPVVTEEAAPAEEVSE